MSYVATKGRFHVALSGLGILLQGSPTQPSYQQGQSPMYGNRFASGDRTYNDLSQWWYYAMTDWSGGMKDDVAWLDDAKFYYSTNIDSWSENGALKLCQNPVKDAAFSPCGQNVLCGIEAEVNGTLNVYIGTDDDSGGKPIIYRYASGTGWASITGAVMPTSQNSISQISARSEYLWMSTVGNGSTYIVARWDGTNWVDESARVAAATAMSMRSSRCHINVDGTLYLFVDGDTKRWAIVKTAVTAPASAGDYTLVVERAGTLGLPVACNEIGGNVYYLLAFTSYGELWKYNPTANTHTKLMTIKNTNIPPTGVGDKLLVKMNDKLILTVPDKEIWTIDSSDTLTRIFVKDPQKYSISAYEASAYLYNGCIISDNKAWWGNLMWDGTNFHNSYKPLDDSNNPVRVLFASSTGIHYITDGTNYQNLFTVDLAGSVFKGTADKNFLVFNNYDTIVSVDKLANAITLIFKPLATGQKIAVEYLFGDLNSNSSWTVLGSASYTADGAISSKRLLFPVGTIFNKVWLRVKLEAGGTTTPSLQDVVMEYLPMPDLKKIWTINVNAADQLNALDGGNVETTGRELRAALEHAWWTKSSLDFQDLDYATTLLNGSIDASVTTVTVDSTKDFAEKGRFHIDDEEILYTGKTPTTFTGCTRGARGTRAATHSDNAVTNNAYKVIMTDFQSRVPVALEGKKLEYVLGISIREV